MARDLELDSAGIAEILNSGQVRDLIHQRAETIADDVRGNVDTPDVVVDDYTTDRAASSVTIRDVRGRAWEARDGVLSRAAARAGLEVTSR